MIVVDKDTMLIVVYFQNFLCGKYYNEASSINRQISTTMQSFQNYPTCFGKLTVNIVRIGEDFRAILGISKELNQKSSKIINWKKHT